MSGFAQEEWNDHARLTGLVTLAWNRTVLQLLRVFSHLTGVESPLAEAIFFSPQSDSTQRRLLRRVAQAVDLGPEDRAALDQLLRRLDKVSTGRNLSAHVIFGVTAFDAATGAWGPKVVPALTPRQDSRLQDDFARQFRDTEAALHKISADLEEWLTHTPFPARAWGGPPLPVAAAEQANLASGDLQVPEDARGTLQGGK